MQKCMKAIAWCFTTHHHEAQPCIWLKRKESSYSALYSVPYSAPTLCGLSPLPQDTPLLFILWMFKYQEICRRPMRAGWSEGLETPPVTGPRVGLTRGCQPLIQRFIKLPDINLLNHHMLMNTWSSRSFCGGPHYWKCVCSAGSPKKERGRLQSMGSQRVRHDWATSLSFTFHFRFPWCKLLTTWCEELTHWKRP